ncbi:MAG: LptF/LptG family permease [Opitutales bacterium]|nr:LptF/LptG family permease [Opitutales bacterium]
MFFQLAAAVGGSLLLFIFVLVTGNVFKSVLGELSNGRISLSMLGEICFLISMSVVPYAMPLGMLTGVLLVLGKMSSSNEILAMKAAGQNLWRIVSPIFLVALIGVVFSGYINCFWAPQATSKYKTMVKSTFRDNPTNLIVPREVFTRFPGFKIYAESREGDRLKNFWIWEIKDGVPVRFTHAAEAVIRYVEATAEDEEDALSIVLKNAVVEERDGKNPADVSGTQFRYSSVAEAPIKISLGKIFSHDIVSGPRRKLRWYTLPELMDLRRTGWKLDYKTAPADEVRKEQVAIQLQIQNYLTSAVACFSLTLLAIPLGIRISRSETFVNIGIALALALTFYLLTTFVSWIEDPDLRPDILVWTPNFIFQIAGFILLRRAAKN